MKIQRLGTPFRLHLACCASPAVQLKNHLDFPFCPANAAPDSIKSEGKLHGCKSQQVPPVAGRNTMFMPWCTHSSHSAALPAAGLSGPPGLGILGVSAC